MGLLRKTNLHVYHAFLYISLPSLHDCENAWFHALWRTSTSDHKFFFLFLKFECSSQEINSREIGLVTFSADWNKRDNVFQVTFSLPSPSSMLKFPILASWVHSKLPKCSYLGIRTLWANCFMTFLMRLMRQIIIAHAQSSMRQCPREMGAYQLHKPPWWKVFSPAAAILESEETMGTRLVEIL